MKRDCFTKGTLKSALEKGAVPLQILFLNKNDCLYLYQYCCSLATMALAGSALEMRHAAPNCSGVADAGSALFLLSYTL
ncbi:MAG: hypothetical protein KUL80_04710 [Comamonas sp.]|nr:hypothetical protein [Comamonas sp.]